MEEFMDDYDFDDTFNWMNLEVFNNIDGYSELESSTRAYSDDITISEESSYSIVVAKQKRVRKRKAGYFPRIVRDDIRRKYLSMFTHILNSYDLAYAQHFFETFCDDKLVFGRHKSGQQLTKINGIDSVMKGMSNCFFVFPDIVMTLSNYEIRRNSRDEYSRLVADVDVSMTLLFDSPTRATIQHSDGSKSLISYAESKEDAEKIANDLKSIGCAGEKVKWPELNLPLLSKPMKYSYTAKLQILVNERKQIEAVEFFE